MKKKSILIVAIILMSIGFAAVSTTLIINGNAKVSENEEDFSVIFTAASLDGKDVYSTVVDDTKKIITFETSELKTLNQTSVLTYEVTNNSSQYDAKVSVTCVPKDGTTAKYTSIKNKLENDATVIKAKEALNGTLTVTLDKTSTKEVSEEYTCKLEFNAVEKNEIGKYTKINKGSYILVKDTENASYDAEVGDTITVGSENFYVISNDNHKVTALAYYNLNVGENKVEGLYGIQNENATGFNQTGLSSYPGAASFSDSTGWEYNLASEIDINQFNGAVKSALYDENTGYENYIQDLGLNAKVRLILKEELSNLGCDINKLTCANSKYKWLYSNSYWINSSVAGNQNRIYMIIFDGNIGTGFYTDKYNYGVRPVIEFTE